jgi:hypothetical protein
MSTTGHHIVDDDQLQMLGNRSNESQAWVQSLRVARPAFLMSRRHRLVSSEQIMHDRLSAELSEHGVSREIETLADCVAEIVV